MSITTYVRKKSLIPVTGHTIQQKMTLKIMFTKQNKHIQLSKLDQKNLELKLLKWKSEHIDSHIFFRPFKLKKILKPGCRTGVSTTCESETAEDENNFEDTLLWIHQEKWQQELLAEYGNDISLMDATYKTTKYELPLFFISVRTNVGYSLWHSSSHKMKLRKIFRKLWKC